MLLSFREGTAASVLFPSEGQANWGAWSGKFDCRRVHRAADEALAPVRTSILHRRRVRPGESHLDAAGAPGDLGSCAACHRSVANDWPLRVMVHFGSSLTYRPGERKTIRVQFRDGVSVGFQATALTSQNTSAGTLEALSSRDVVTTREGGGTSAISSRSRGP